MGLRGKNNIDIPVKLVNNNNAAEDNITNNTVVKPLLLRSSRRGLKDSNKKKKDDGGDYNKKGVNSEKDVNFTKDISSEEEEEEIIEEESSVDTEEEEEADKEEDGSEEDDSNSKHGSKDVDDKSVDEQSVGNEKLATKDSVDDAANKDHKSDEDKDEEEEPTATVLLRETDEDDEILVDEEFIPPSSTIESRDVDTDAVVVDEEDGAETEVPFDENEIEINLNSDGGDVVREEEEVEKSEDEDDDIEGGSQSDSGSADIGNVENADNDTNGESGDNVATEDADGGGGKEDESQDDDDVEELSSVASVLNDEEEGDNVESGDKKNSVSSKSKDGPVEVQEEEEEEEEEEAIEKLDSATEDDEDSKDEVGEVTATNEDEEALVLDDTAAKKSTAIDDDDDEVEEEEAKETANNLSEDSSSPLESVTISNLKDSVSDDEDAVAESIEKDWETKVEIPLDKELAAIDNAAVQQQSKSDYVDNNEKSSDGHEYLPDDGSGDDDAGETIKVTKTGEWDEDDDDDKVDVSASEMKSSVGGVADINQKTDQELKTEIENKLEMALEGGDLDEEQAEELDEEMEEAIDEGVGEVFEEKLESELELREADKETVKTAGMAIIGLSRDDNASTVVLVDDPPVIGEVSGVAASSSSLSEEGTNPSNNIQGHTFDNLLCKDDPESYLAAENICESIKRRIDEGGCDEELFTVDVAVQGVYSSVYFDGADKVAADASVNVSEVLRVEEAVHSTNDDDDDVNNEQRRLTFKAGYYDENGEVANDEDGLLQGDTERSGTVTRNGTVTATSNKLVVTVGSRHCPETCNVVSECERARDYFNPDIKSSSSMEQLSEAEFDTNAMENTEADDNVSLLGSDNPDVIPSANTNTTRDSVIDTALNNTVYIDGVPASEVIEEHSGQEGEHEGQEYVSEGKLATEVSCQDDPNFLYKDKPGFTCEYMAANKPDKCIKPLFVTSCPVSCNLVEECEQLMNGVSAASIDDKEGNLEVSDLKHAMSTGLNSTMGAIEKEESIMFEDETPSELLGNTTAMHEVSCKDDKQFLYKDKPGFTCEYIALNKPDKCFKLHDGDKVGAISCPESCNMIQECEDMYDATGVVMSTKSDYSLDTSPIAEEDQSLLVVEGESGGFDDKGSINSVMLTGEDMEEMSAVDSVNTTEVTDVPEQEDIADPPLANDRSDGYESGVNGNGWSADSEDEPLAPTATESSTLCKDSESFLYKDKPGYTCAVLGEMKPEKCLKLHNGVAIGLSSCPESCNMVDQCLDAYPSKSTAAVSNEYNKPYDASYTAAVQDEEAEAPLATEVGGAMQGVENEASFDQDRGDDGTDKEFKYMDDEEDTVGRGDVMASLGTKSMADEIYHEEIVKNLAAPVDGADTAATGLDNGSNSFGGSAFKSVDNDDYKESTDDDMEGGYNNNPDQVTGSFEPNIDGWGDETKDEMFQNNGWDNNQVDEDDNEDVPNSNNWEDSNDAEWADESNSWNAKSLDEKKLPWDTPTNGNNLESPSEGYYQEGVPTNNVVPSGQETVPSLNTDTDGYAWELDDDEGGFPLGLFIALLAVFIFFVYRKSQNRNEASRDCTSRGGYQRVQPLEGHSKKW